MEEMSRIDLAIRFVSGAFGEGCADHTTAIEDTPGSHALRIYLQNMDNRARQIYPQPDPLHAGTKHLQSLDQPAHGYVGLQLLIVSVAIVRRRDIEGSTGFEQTRIAYRGALFKTLVAILGLRTHIIDANN